MLKVFKRIKAINISTQAASVGSRGSVSNPKVKPEGASIKV